MLREVCSVRIDIIIIIINSHQRSDIGVTNPLFSREYFYYYRTILLLLLLIIIKGHSLRRAFYYYYYY